MLNLSMGIDVGQRQSVIFALSSAGEIVIESQKIETFDDQAWRTLLESLADRFSLRACFEVGPHYEWLYDLLMEYCQEVEVVNASDFAVISRSQKKTDKIDAQKLAEGFYRGDLPTVYVPCKAVRKGPTFGFLYPQAQSNFEQGERPDLRLVESSEYEVSIWRRFGQSCPPVAG